MTIKSRIDKLEDKPEYRQDLLLVTKNEDGTYSDMFGRRYNQDDLKSYGSRVLVFNPHKPEGSSR